MDIKNKATRIDLFNISSPQMRAFHLSWFSFFLCFFAWFGIAPLMAVVRDELGLTKTQVGNTIIASVAITIVARLFVGWLCDRVGPRLTYTWLLVLASIPVMGIGFAHNYETFLLFRLAIGAIGASFVITQYHTSVMFAPNCVGTANATSAGWGNLGGGVTQMIMPLIFAIFIGLGYSEFWSWRLSMVIAGVVCFLTGIAYFFLVTDYPNGNRKDLIKSGEIPAKVSKAKGTFWLAAKDPRVWALFVVYGACFGVELTINNIAALYFKDYFDLGLKAAGLVAGLFGLMNIFARTMGGIIGDKFGRSGGLRGRVKWLFIALFIEGAALLLFSKMNILSMAIGSMVVFSLFVQMSEGATYSVVPFINKKALGSVAGIVGAGGNMGAVGAGFLFRSEDLSWPQSLFILGIFVVAISFFTYFVTFSKAEEKAAKIEHDKALATRKATQKRKPWITFPDISGVRPMELLRVYLGIGLMIKGIYFLVNMKTIEAMTGLLGHFEGLLAWFVMGAHIGGGLCLIAGFVTRFAAAANMIIVFGAILFVHSTEGLFAPSQGLEFSLLVLFSLSLVFWHGSGKLSFDHYLEQN